MRAIAVRNGLPFYTMEEADTFLLPFIGTPVKAGFPSPAQDFMEEDIDLVAFLGMNKPSIRILRVGGDFLVNAHAPSGSFLIVDTDLIPLSQDLVVVLLNGEYLVRTIVKSTAGWVLYSSNSHKNPIIVGEGDAFLVWGVVVQVIIPTRRKPQSIRDRVMPESVDLSVLLAVHKPSAFLIRVEGNSMQDEHVPNNSYLVVDRSLKPLPNDIVVAVLNGDFTVKTLVKSATGWMLYPANAVYNPIIIKKDDDFQVWGVVAHVIIDRKEMRKRND